MYIGCCIHQASVQYLIMELVAIHGCQTDTWYAYVVFAKYTPFPFTRYDYIFYSGSWFRTIYRFVTINDIDWLWGK